MGVSAASAKSMTGSRSKAPQHLTVVGGTGTASAPTIELPHYFVPRWSKAKARFRFYTQFPKWARKMGCPVKSAPLGLDLQAALAAHAPSLRAFRTWQQERGGIVMPQGPAPNTIEWLQLQYKDHRRYKDDLKPKSKRSYDEHLKRLCDHVFQKGRHQGRRLGDLPYKSIDETVVDKLIDELLIKEVVVAGITKIVKRRRQTRHVVTTAATMWKVCEVIVGRKTLGDNPFSGHRVKRDTIETAAATVDELCDVVLAADAHGLSIVGTLAMCAWELCWRPEHVVEEFRVEHYRPANKPKHVWVIDAKNGKRAWRPLFDVNGTCLYPRLVERLEALKGARTTGMMMIRDGIDLEDGSVEAGAHQPLTMWWARRKIKEAAVAAGHPELTLATFRHGGLTEGGEAGLNEHQMMSLSLHKDAKVIYARYLKVTDRTQQDSQRQRKEFRDSSAEGGRGAAFLAGVEANQTQSEAPGPPPAVTSGPPLLLRLQSVLAINWDALPDVVKAALQQEAGLVGGPPLLFRLQSVLAANWDVLPDAVKAALQQQDGGSVEQPKRRSRSGANARAEVPVGAQTNDNQEAA